MVLCETGLTDDHIRFTTCVERQDAARSESNLNVTHP